MLALIDHLTSEKLQFITEPEAAAMHCMQVSKEHFVIPKGKSYMVVNCGEDTVASITRKFISTDVLGEVTGHTSDFCGSNYVDRNDHHLCGHVY
ncbi:hypothetical protein Glove_109g158 [Diversispora epigaea]|uniref:Uncharacterized protein n=1 Tax=Diversispora epigaea TaxID=1348612 RepID=A0A397J626_9GLOM|nr:hypothetical protein Glove_109g158 [Diversispora epigaea]